MVHIDLPDDYDGEDESEEPERPSFDGPGYGPGWDE